MANIEIYTSPWCGYCHRAKRLLDKKCVQYAEYDVTVEPARRQEMMQRAPGNHTVPQIFIDDQPIGGCDEMFELDFDGELNAMLGVAA